MTRYLGYLVLVLAGGLLYVVFDDPWKGLGLFAASLLIDYGLDMALLRHEKDTGQID